jgi:hypothetical protein
MSFLNFLKNRLPLDRATKCHTQLNTLYTMMMNLCICHCKNPGSMHSFGTRGSYRRRAPPQTASSIHQSLHRIPEAHEVYLATIRPRTYCIWIACNLKTSCRLSQAPTSPPKSSLPRTCAACQAPTGVPYFNMLSLSPRVAPLPTLVIPRSWTKTGERSGQPSHS